MDVLIQDLRYALRSLARAPGFTAIVVVIMALGIGVNAMVFSMVYGILFRPWPLPDFERVVRIVHSHPRDPDDTFNLSWPTFLDLREGAKSFEAIGGFWDHNAFVVIDKDVERLYAGAVTAGLFEALGVKPVLGRGFRPSDNELGNNWGVVVISHDIWQKRYGGRTDVLGRTLRLNGRVREIVGVMPPGFRWPEFQDFWIPIGIDPATDNVRTNSFLMTAARLKPGVTLAQAQAEVAGIVGSKREEFPRELRDIRTQVRGYSWFWARGIRPMMVVMAGAVACVLLVACANVANLLLARAANRRREIGVRLSLGASRGRIVRQLLTESALLAGAGALLGYGLAVIGTRFWVGSIPMDLPFFMRFDLDLPVVAYTAGITVLAAVLFGLTPALHATDLRLTEALRDGAAQAGGSVHRNRLRASLVVAEVAMSIVLLVGTGLFVRSFFRIVDAGRTLRTEGVLTSQLLLPFASHPTDADKLGYFRQLLPQLRALPGVQAVSAVGLLPLNRNNNTNVVVSSRQPDLSAAEAPRTNSSPAYPGYFSLIGIPLLKGRDFRDSDDEKSARVAIVNQSLAKRLWPGREPVGERLKFLGQPDSIGWWSVIGVVKDVAQNVEGDDVRAAVFVPHAQSADQTMTLVLRSQRDPASLSADVRRVVRTLHGDAALYETRTLPEALKFSMWTRRLFTGLMGVFGLLALIIAGVGIYGVMAYSVAQRTHEIGIRMALGAAQQQVARMVVTQAMRLTAIGLGLGLAAAWALTRTMASVLFEVRPDDPPTYVGVSVILVASSLLAAWLPALRATRVDPMVALRAE
jgi:putative ABC transport system permease protein